MTTYRRGPAASVLPSVVLGGVVLALLTGCTSGPAGAGAGEGTAAAGGPSASAPARTPSGEARAGAEQLARLKRSIDFDAQPGWSEHGYDTDPVMAGTTDLPDAHGIRDESWRAGTYRFSVVCAGGGVIEAEVAAGVEDRWTAACDAVVHERVVESTRGPLHLTLKGLEGARGPAVYRVDPVSAATEPAP
ncbi:hypothetical protein [Streptomyces sp. NPDC097619]|uniref:hypothetical protein n=1 Tax=Streptomyces sp. NPDC097619 TaxID=3157228 RepID=UPI00332600EC